MQAADTFASVIIGMIAAMPGILAYYSAKKKLRIEAQRQGIDQAATIVSGATALIGPLRTEIEDLRADVKQMTDERRELKVELHELRTSVHVLRTGIDRLIHQLQSHNIDPVWQPEDKGD